LTHFHYYAADLCQYFFRLDEHLEQAIKHGVAWHAISMRTPHFSVKRGHVVTPSDDIQNAFRLEQVASGAIQHCKRSIAVHVDRHAEYAPIRSDIDAKAAVQSLGMLHQSWLRSSGGAFEENRYANSKRDQRCEVSPLVSYAGEDLAGLFDTSVPQATKQVHKSAAGRQADRPVKKLPLPCHIDSGVEHMEGQARHMDKFQATFADQVMFVPWQSSSEQEVDAVGMMTEEQVKHLHIERGFVEHAAVAERLPLTPRWLKDEEVHWEHMLRDKMRKFERMMELEALKGSKKWMNSANMDTLLEQYEKEQANLPDEEGQEEERRPRTRTMPVRPDKDEGTDVVIRYGTPSYFKKDEKSALEAIQELDEARLAEQSGAGTEAQGTLGKGKKHHKHHKHHKK